MHFPLFFLVSLLLMGTARAQNDCSLIKQESVNKNGKTDFLLLKSYNLEGQIIEENTTTTGFQGSNSEKTIFEYNAKGYLSKVSAFHNETFRSAKIYNYNNLGQLIAITETTDPNEIKTNNKLTTSRLNSEKLFFAEDNSISARVTTTKNENGQILNYEIRNGSGEINHSKEFIYSQTGEKTYEKRNDVVGGMVEEIVTSYNSSNGNIEKDSTYLNGKLIRRTLYTYASGFLTDKTVIGRNNKLDYQIQYVNNVNGDLIKESFLYQGRLMNSIEKSYDPSGNLILEKSFDANSNLLKTKTWEYQCPT
ncbi:MAG: hypothetical protein ACI8UX_002517 [Psychromonas sp.]|jgi:hypothetical protein